MAFTVSTIPVQAGDRAGEAVALAAGDARAEVWPTHGFNCLRWQVRQPDGSWGDLLYVAPDWATNPVPTRSGHPVLFPFPNRLRGGTFTHAGQAYQLPKNSGENAIHGFTPRLPWRVTAAGADADSVYVTGEFRLAEDAPQAVWPADARLSLTYRLTPTALQVEAVVDSPDGKELPFGLGYHPYFRVPGAAGPDVGGYLLTARAGEVWPLDGGVPTGGREPVPAEVDFRTERPVGATQLDTLYTAVEPVGGPPGEVASLTAQGCGRLAVCVGPEWRELLLFTPPHRQAVAIEPYTCASNAPNMPDAGWRVLPAGGRFAADVEYRWRPTG
jgi:aldose 1-epimerase